MSGFEEFDYNSRFDIKLWKNLIKYALNYKKQLIILGIIMILAGGIDAVFPLMTRYAIDNFVVPGKTDGLVLFAAVFFIIILFQGSNVYILIRTAGKIQTGLSYDIRKAAFRRLQELSLSYYDRTPVGWIMARMTSDTGRLGDFIAWGFVDVIWGTTMIMAIAVLMFVLNWQLALITLAVIPVLIIISVYFQRIILKLFRKVRKQNSKITGAFNEGIMGAKTSKTIVREEENQKEFNVMTGDMYNYSIKAQIISSVYLPVVITLGSIGTGLALWFGGIRVNTGIITYGTLVAFISYSMQFFEPVRELARIFSDFQSAQASAERVFTLLNTVPEIIDFKSITEEYGDLFNAKHQNWSEINGDIHFDKVTFNYKEGEEVLKDFSLQIKKGETVALIGETGSGKSTLVNLICRFYEPVKGRILIDGTDYRERSQLWLHSRLGYMLQTPHLFSGTIRDNIRYGRLEATDDEVVEAAKIVMAHEFISEMEKGYDTEVGEGGNRLSTGQKQLISFARAILANPAIFILDEATSSIDTATEKLIQQAIEKVLEGRTSVIIAHRLSTVRNADRIIVLEKGEIVEEGIHEELIKQKGRYFSFYTSQVTEEMLK